MGPDLHSCDDNLAGNKFQIDMKIWIITQSLLQASDKEIEGDELLLASFETEKSGGTLNDLSFSNRDLSKFQCTWAAV